MLNGSGRQEEIGGKMNADELNLLAMDFSEGDMVQNILEKRFIIGYGTINDIPFDGVVSVLVSVSKDKSAQQVVTCPYATLMTSSVAVKIKPNIEDKVILVSPQLFDVKMFSKKQLDTIFDETAFGYSALACIALPLSAFRNGEYDNIISIEDGKVKAELAYDENSEKNNFTLDINKDGELEVNCSYKNGEYQGKLSIDKDGVLTFSNPKTTFTIDNSGNIKIETDGKFTFKNNTTDLKTVLSALKTEIANLQTVGSPATQKTSPNTITSLSSWESTQLNQLLG